MPLDSTPQILQELINNLLCIDAVGHSEADNIVLEELHVIAVQAVIVMSGDVWHDGATDGHFMINQFSDSVHQQRYITSEVSRAASPHNF